MIIWLASYPKSGNTWVRLFLDAILFNENKELKINETKIKQFPLREDFTELDVDVDNVEGFVSNCLISQERVNLDNSIKIFKTHNAYWKTGNYAFTDEKNTQGVIHIVRDPRNVITSLKNHYNQKTYNEALEFMTNEKQYIGSSVKKKSFDLPTVISSWSNHYKSWKKMKKNYLLVRYEDLTNNTLIEFTKIANYLERNYQISFNKDQIQKAIEKCNFDNLKKQENKEGFVEAPSYEGENSAKKFFFLGPKNNWQSLLDAKIQKSIENKFKSEMLELGYL